MYLTMCLPMFSRFDQWLHSWAHCDHIGRKCLIRSTCIHHVSAGYILKYTQYLISVCLQWVLAFSRPKHAWAHAEHILNPVFMVLPVCSRWLKGAQIKCKQNAIKMCLVNTYQITLRPHGQSHRRQRGKTFKMFSSFYLNVIAGHIVSAVSMGST